MFEIIWLPQAEIDFDKILLYLRQNWGDKVVNDFIVKFEKIIELIIYKPKMFRHSKKMNIHQVLITKHNLLFYRINGNKVELLTFFNTRQNPTNKPF